MEYQDSVKALAGRSKHMKPSKQTVVIAIIVAVVLFFVGLSTWGKLLALLLPIVGNTKYLSTSMAGQFRNSILFGFTLALIPIATIFIWRFAPVFKPQRRVLTGCIIIVVMTISVLVRREMVKLKATNLPPTTTIDYSDLSNSQSRAIESGIPIETVKFELFACAGLVIGGIIAFFTLRENKNG